MDEENVCIGDVFKVGNNVLLQVSEPRHPCYKLNSRFEWPRALKRTLRTGRHGWNYRVLQTGTICSGDTITLVDRPFPQWSLMNVQRVIRAKSVPLHLMAECAGLPMTDLWADLARDRLKHAPKTYVLVDAHYVSPRVRKLTFALKESLKFSNPDFEPYAFAQIRFGPGGSFSRSYSIIEGDLNKFSLGVAKNDQSRGGSVYLHERLAVGDVIEMSPGANPRAIEKDKLCEQNGPHVARTVLIGGIGVTAFLPAIREWESKGLQYQIHYAVRSPDEAPFLDELPRDKTRVYAKSNQERLDISSVIPPPGPNGEVTARIFSCGPSRMMRACEERTAQLGYPEHMVHFEQFGNEAGGNLGDEFEVEVDEPDANRHERLLVPPHKTLLDVLNEAGFDVLFSCKSGGCGACKVTVCNGEVDYRSRVLTAKEKGKALQSCVDRGIGRLHVEID